MFDLLNGSSISYNNRNYTLVEDIKEDQEDKQEKQENIQENLEDIHDPQDDIQDYEEFSSRNTTEEAVETTGDNSTVVLAVKSTETSMVQERVRAENLGSSIIIGCSAVGVVSMVVLILLVLYCSHRNNDPDLRARELRGEKLQIYSSTTHNFQVKFMLIFVF